MRKWIADLFESTPENIHQFIMVSNNFKKMGEENEFKKVEFSNGIPPF